VTEGQDQKTILDWPTLQRVFDEAVQKPADQRAQFLEEHCASDPALKRQVESLLRGLDDFDAAISPAKIRESLEAELPESIGPYRILSLLGRGGMGAVYLAERADAEFRLKVAIKVSRNPLFDESSRMRFRVERQILANLSHPNIARLLDGGTTAGGVPFIVMEYVDGIPITEWCARPGVTAQQRFDLFRQICSAVQAAHQNLVIHRDIKPGNILVTSDGTPKLLDFGIAKLLDPDASGVTVALTRATDRLMTPQYASPEQISGEAITTASDVYSLGTLLYELLSGKAPYDLTGMTMTEIERTVRTVNPPALPGDVGRIVEKAMHKDPARRYGSAGELSLDVGRLMDGLPVLARPDSVRYRLQLWARRNRGLAISLATLSVTIVLLLVSLAAGLYFTRQSQLRAERRFNEVRALANALIFDIHDKVIDLPGSLLARKFIVERAIGSLTVLEKDAGADPQFQMDLARAWQRVSQMQFLSGGVHIGDGPGAVKSLERAAALAETAQRQLRGDARSMIVAADIVASLAVTSQLAGGAKPGESLVIARRAHAMISPVDDRIDGLDAAHAEKLLAVHVRYGVSLQNAGELKPALESLQFTEKLGRAVLARFPSDDEGGIRWLLGNCLYRMGDVLGGSALNLNRLPDGLVKYREADAAYEQLRKQFPNSTKFHSGTLFILQRIASIQERMGNVEAALTGMTEWRNRLAEARKVDPANLETLRNHALSYSNSGTLLQKLNRLQEAEVSLREGLRLNKELLTRTKGGAQAVADVGVTLLALGITQNRMGRHRDAIVTLQEASVYLDKAITLLPDLPMTRWRQGRVHEWIGKSHEALKSGQCRQAYEKAAEQFEYLRTANKISNVERDEPERLRKLASSCGAR
jgi:eukaryotic-like serine/threonine-protein kinase